METEDWRPDIIGSWLPCGADDSMTLLRVDFFARLMARRWLDIHQRRLARSETHTIGRVENPHGWHDSKEEMDPSNILYRALHRYQRF